MTSPVTDKDALRAAVRARRRQRSERDRDRARTAVRHQVLDRIGALGLPPGATVAGYEPLPSEPGSTELLTGLATAGYRVLVPITLTDHDLDWREFDRPAALGVHAIGGAAVILLPAFAVDPAGHRLGRGGGSYDRALTRADPTAVTVALLFADELIASVPVDPWDQPVRAAVTPAGWHDLDQLDAGTADEAP